jgi:hypothetical protein
MLEFMRGMGRNAAQDDVVLEAKFQNLESLMSSKTIAHK